MAPDVAAVERLDDRAIALDPGAIEGKFTEIWRATSGAAYDESSIRLRVLNFVAFAREPTGVERFREVMGALPQRYPCRGILAVAAPGQEQLNASISAGFWRSASGARHVCSEEVRLVGSADQEPELASAVLALLVPELPVAIWLMDAPDLGGRMSREILETADRVFFDTAGQADAADVFDHILRAGREFELELCDLAWGRIATWRELVAQFFDGHDGMRELSQIQSIEVDGGSPRLSSEALLLAGWLVSRLGLSLAYLAPSGGRIEATLYDGTRGVTLRVARGPDGGAAPLREVRIRTAGALLSVGIHPESAHMHVREERHGAPSHRTVASVPGDDASAIAAALDDRADPAIYAEALGSALALLAVPASDA